MTPYTAFLNSLQPETLVRIQNSKGEVIRACPFVRFENGHVVVHFENKKIPGTNMRPWKGVKGNPDVAEASFSLAHCKVLPKE